MCQEKTARISRKFTVRSHFLLFFVRPLSYGTKAAPRNGKVSIGILIIPRMYEYTYTKLRKYC